MYENFLNFGSGLGGVSSAVSSVVGGIGSAIQARKNRKLARELAQKQQDFQSAEAEKAFQRNIQMWERQNAYNSPSAMMQRLEQAGLNPNLAMNSLSAGQASTPPSYNPPSVVQPSESLFANPYESISQMGTNLATVSLSTAQEAQTRAQTKNVEQQTYRIALQNAYLLPAEITDALNAFSYNPKMREQAYALGALGIQRAQFDLQLAEKSVTEMQKKLEGLDYDNKIKQLDLAFKQLTQDSRIEAAAAENGMTIEKAKQFGKMLQNELLAGQYNVQILYSKWLEESKDDAINIAEKESNKVKAEQNKRENKWKETVTDPNTKIGKVVNTFRGAAGMLKWFLSGVADTISPVTGEIGKAVSSMFK